MESIKKLIKKINWDNDVVRVMDDLDKDGPIQFTYDRTVNSLIETCIVLIERVEELTAKVEALTPKEKKTTKKAAETKEEAPTEDA